MILGAIRILNHVIIGFICIGLCTFNVFFYSVELKLLEVVESVMVYSVITIQNQSLVQIITKIELKSCAKMLHKNIIFTSSRNL